MLNMKKISTKILLYLIELKKITTKESRTYNNDKIIATKQGSVVCVTLNNCISTSTTVRTTLGTLPEGWRPPALMIAANISGNIGYGCVTYDGDIQVYRSDRANDRVDTTVTYIATH